jgi:hypothetical protein
MSRASSSEKRQQWVERMQRYTASGLTVAAFCVAESVSIASFYQWRRKLSPAPEPVQGSSPEPSKQRFVAVRIAGVAQLDVYLPNGTRICLPGSDASLIDAVVAAAGRVPSISRGEEAAC